MFIKDKRLAAFGVASLSHIYKLIFFKTVDKELINLLTFEAKTKLLNIAIFIQFIL